MRCSQARASLSAELDGEAPTANRAAADDHVAGCAACQEWSRQVVAVSRQASIQAAPSLDRLAAQIIRQASRKVSPHRTERRALRSGLCLIGLVQLAVAIPVLILGHDREAPLHVSHEMGSWDAALAIGLLLAARRPSRAEGMSAIVGVGALLLAITAVIDLAAGRTSLMDEAPHLLCIAGWLLLHRLASITRPEAPESPSAVGGSDLPLPSVIDGVGDTAPGRDARDVGAGATDLSA